MRDQQNVRLVRHTAHGTHGTRHTAHSTQHTAHLVGSLDGVAHAGKFDSRSAQGICILQRVARKCDRSTAAVADDGDLIVEGYQPDLPVGVGFAGR